jgi:hypothetical protein
MGLLDDAIRDHLELKRLRGADPSEVICKEREALGPVVRGEDGTSAEHEADSKEPATAGEGHAFDSGESPDSDDSHLSQETVELDMRAVLDGESIEQADRATPDTLPPVMSAAPPRARAEHSASEGGSIGDFLEWEMPMERDHDFSRRLREDASLRRPRITDARETPAGDALAGIPQSLFDTHGQERLWLDRKPKHDLGFDG